jgi:hypothetical protein
LWRYFFKLNKTGKPGVVGSVGFILHRYMKLEYVDLVLPDNTTDWKQGWLYLNNPVHVLPDKMGRAPILFPY